MAQKHGEESIQILVRRPVAGACASERASEVSLHLLDNFVFLPKIKVGFFGVFLLALCNQLAHLRGRHVQVKVKGRAIAVGLDLLV